MAGNVELNLAGLGDAIRSVVDLARGIREVATGKAIMDPKAQAELANKAAELEKQMAEIDAQAMASQAKINELEAAKGGFAGNWRPFIGWVCGTAIGYEFVVSPLVNAIVRAWSPAFAMPRLDMDQILTLTVTLLGMATLRTAERFKGVHR